MTEHVICPRCRVSVPLDKVGIPNRCMVKDCPLNKQTLPSVAPYAEGLVFTALAMGTTAILTLTDVVQRALTYALLFWGATE